MSDYPDIFVIRHGQTEWNLEGRHQGQLDSPLTETGIAQARAMGALLQSSLQNPSAFGTFTSPQGRAVQTARFVLGPLGLTATHDDRLREIAFGEWEGLVHEDIRTRWPERAALAETEGFMWHFQSPGGERLQDLQNRARSFLEALEAPAIIVTHGVLSRVMRALWLGLDEHDMLDLPSGQGVIFHLSASRGHRIFDGLQD